MSPNRQTKGYIEAVQVACASLQSRGSKIEVQVRWMTGSVLWIGNPLFNLLSALLLFHNYALLVCFPSPMSPSRYLYCLSCGDSSTFPTTRESKCSITVGYSEPDRSIEYVGVVSQCLQPWRSAHSMQWRTQCNGARYGTHLNIDSCRTAIYNEMAAGLEIGSWGMRHDGHLGLDYNVPLPYGLAVSRRV